jgi:ABC-2 type transport system ATP-binding protein
MPLPVALSLLDIRARYGPRLALDGVSLDVRRGEIVGLLGPNGSGKSTLIAVAAGLLDPCAGEVAIEGQPRAADPRGFAARIGLVPQDSALYDELTAGENLLFFGRLYALSGHDLRRRVARTLSRVGLAGRGNERVGTLSGGMRQRLNLAAALIHDPPILLLDEPTAALDPAARDGLHADLTRLRDEGHAILLSTHHVDEAEQACDRVAVLDRGRLAAEGVPAAVLHFPAERPVLFGQLADRPPKFLVKAIRDRLGDGVELEVTGRRLRLSAGTNEDLGLALAGLLAEGVELDGYRTPPGTIERALREVESP